MYIPTLKISNAYLDPIEIKIIMLSFSQAQTL